MAMRWGMTIFHPVRQITRLYIVKHKNSILSPIAQVFYDYARKYYEKHPEKAPE